MAIAKSKVKVLAMDILVFSGIVCRMFRMVFQSLNELGRDVRLRGMPAISNALLQIIKERRWWLWGRITNLHWNKTSNGLRGLCQWDLSTGVVPLTTSGTVKSDIHVSYWTTEG